MPIIIYYRCVIKKGTRLDKFNIQRKQKWLDANWMEIFVMLRYKQLSGQLTAILYSKMIFERMDFLGSKFQTFKQMDSQVSAQK